LQYHSKPTSFVSLKESHPFYSALGGKLVHEKELEIGGKPLIEVAYGWMDSGSLRMHLFSTIARYD
jgi:hypothetical protein